MSEYTEKTTNNNQFKNQINKIETTVQDLEHSLINSTEADRQLLRNIHLDGMKCQGLKNQLQEVQNENKQLLDMLQQRNSDEESSRKTSRTDLTPSYSTMSIVHLQYKYEELLTNQDGLLKILNTKTTELKKVFEENQRLREENELIQMNLVDCRKKMNSNHHKMSVLKDRKNAQIEKLKREKETLKLVHNQLVNLLHDQCMEKDYLLCDEIKNSSESEKALLLQEIRKNNILTYENFQLSQEIDYLHSIMQSDNNNEKLIKKVSK